MFESNNLKGYILGEANNSAEATTYQGSERAYLNEYDRSVQYCEHDGLTVALSNPIYESLAHYFFLACETMEQRLNH